MGWLTGYSTRREIIIDYTKVSAAVTDFPITVFLTSSNFAFSGCDNNGYSIRFTTADGTTLLNYEREVFDPAAQSAIIHVKVPSISSTADTLIYMYYKAESDRFEQFVDSFMIDSQSGLTQSINRPVKTGAPIFGDPSWTYDRAIAYVNVITDPDWPTESRFRKWYQGTDNSSNYNCCYSYSANGETDWVKPNLGQVTYDGNTNNNIFSPDGIDHYQQAPVSMVWDKPTGRYILQTSVANVAGALVSANNIYSSTNPAGPWILEKSLPAWSDSSLHPGHGMGLTKRADGRWIAYYQHWSPTGSFRSVGCYISNTEDLSGDWTDCGLTLIGVSPADQRHGQSSNVYYGASLFGVGSNCDAETYPGPIFLLSMRNGLDQIMQDTAWIPFGTAGTWDDSQLIEGSTVKVGNEWYCYYVGAASKAALPHDRYMGLAKIGYGRIGQIARTTAGEGYVVTKPFTVGADGLFINAIADGASDYIKAELLDASDDSVITGFAKADCTAFTGDTYSSEILWGSSRLFNSPIGRVKIKFYLSKTTNNVRLFTYMSGSEADCTRDCSTPGGVWDDTYVAVYHGTDDQIRLADKTLYTRNSKIPSFGVLPALNKQGTKQSAAHPPVVTSAIGQGHSYNGTSEYIDYSTGAGQFGTGDFTVETYSKRSGVTPNFRQTKLQPTGAQGWQTQLSATTVDFNVGIAGTFKTLTAAVTPGTTNHYVGAKRASGTGYLRYDADQVHTLDISGNCTSTAALKTGVLTYPTNIYYGGTLDEMRISIAARSDAWMAATNYALSNALLAVGGAESLKPPRMGFITFDL